MRYTIITLISISLFLLWSCESPTSNNTKQPTPIDDQAEVPKEEAIDITSMPGCQFSVKILDGNKIWFPSKKVFAIILADSSSYDVDYGDGHRIFALADEQCDIIFRKKLPVAESPDYGYYLSPINYNNSSNLIGIRGFDLAYVFDIDQQKMLPPLSPDFLSERLGEDAQSGRILRLEVWESFLVGFAQDFGTFVFDLRQKEQPKAILPIAEYAITESNFASLFALPSKDDKIQLISPVFDFEKDKFEINPILEEPLSLNTNLAKNIRNNKVVVLRENNAEKTAIVVDVKDRKLIELPEEIQTKKTGEILKWIKTNNQ